MKPRVYLAGTMVKNDWRHYLVPGLREHDGSDGSLELPDFTYVGPFFVSCDHRGTIDKFLHERASASDRREAQA